MRVSHGVRERSFQKEGQPVHRERIGGQQEAVEFLQSQEGRESETRLEESGSGF